MGEVTIRHGLKTDLDAVIQLLDDVDHLHRSALPWLVARRPAEPSK